MEEFFGGKEDMFDDYKHKLEEVRYFGVDSQNLQNHFWCLGFCLNSNVKSMDLGLF
jgi:hypothetical protein